MNLGHLFLKWGEGETFSPLAELKNEGHARHRTSSQHIRVCTFAFKIVCCAQKAESWQLDVSDAGIIFYLFFFNSCHTVRDSFNPNFLG
jgi:hypothetical protein